MEKKKEMQIRRAIQKFEKEQNIYAPSYLGDGDHQNSMDGKETETRSFKLKVRLGVPDSYHTGGYVAYDVYDKIDGLKYLVRHFFPNKGFDNSYGWEMEEIKEEKS